MDIQSELRTDLWNAINTQYQSANYSQSIIIAINLLRDTIREISGLDGDGASLVGQAFGGDSPKIRLNKLETETDKDEQKGVESVIRGIFQSIRNPRIHDNVNDTKEVADEIIIFINYLLNRLKKAQGPYTIEEWINRVMDPDFVVNERYAKLLIAEVPVKMVTGTIVSLYNRKNDGEREKIKLVFRLLLERMTEVGITKLLEVISINLKTESEIKAIRMTLYLLPPKYWLKIDEVSKMRIENKLIKSINEGEIDEERDMIEGRFGTWARDYFEYFTLIDEARKALLNKLSGSCNEKSYVAKYLWNCIPFHIDPPLNDLERSKWVKAICEGILEPLGSTNLRESLSRSIFTLPENWRLEIIEGLSSLEKSEPEYYKKITIPSEEEEIPF